MINTNALHKLLTIADVTQDPYAVAEVAASLLAANPQDSLAAIHHARALAAMKLVRTPWSSRARRFAVNLRALESRLPHIAERIQDLSQQLDAFQLHVAADGNYQIRDAALPFTTPSAWLGNLADHKSATRLWQFDRSITPVPAPILFDGLGYGWLFLHVFQTTANSFLNYSCALYILEPDLPAFTMLLHLHDLQEILTHPRFRLFMGLGSGDNPSGERALAEFHRAVQQTPSWSVPERFVRSALRARSELPLEQAINSLRAERSRSRTQLLASANEYYAAKDAHFWHARFADPTAKLRVLGITSRYTTVLQHSIAELQSAANAAGADMRIVMEPDDHSLENPFIEEISAFKPDLIVQISRLRHENPHLPRNIPFLCWDQDNLPCMRTPQATASLDALTFVAGHAALHGFAHLNWPRRNLIFCHPAGATFRYSAEPVPAELHAAHQADFSFISNAAATPEEIKRQQSIPWQSNTHLATLFNRCADSIISQMDAGTIWEFHDLRNLIRTTASELAQRNLKPDAPPALTGPLINELVLTLGLVADRCFRHAALRWVARFCQSHNCSLRLYGAGWDKHAVFSRYAAGAAQPGLQIRAIYQASKINLHLMENGGFLHSRTLDGIAAGGFFLTRLSPNDGADAQRVHAQNTLASRAVQLQLRTRRDIEACGDPEVQAAWAHMSPFFPGLQPDDLLTGLTLWKELPAARALMPQLPRITFSNEGEFAELARQYLADDGLRRSLSAEMRTIVLRDMSYSSRWTQFQEAIVQGLSEHATPPFRGPAEEVAARTMSSPR